jgi:SAM-dependent methyltransferase
MHGRIEHGFQYQFPDRRYWPTSYFGPGSGIGMAIRYHPRRVQDRFSPGSLRVGIVGLGTATLASYGRAGDYFRFYEINPEVVRLSRRYFTYLQSCPAKVDVVLGDARISMEQEKIRGELQQFDILAVDAFSSDAIPVHLLTRECLEIYRVHLKPDGILALHLSSRYFDLTPVARGLAGINPIGATQALRITGISNQSQGVDASDWVLLTANRRFLDTAEVRRAARPWTTSDRPPQLWTDDHNNLFQLLTRRNKG